MQNTAQPESLIRETQKKGKKGFGTARVAPFIVFVSLILEIAIEAQSWKPNRSWNANGASLDSAVTRDARNWLESFLLELRSKS
ncbi:hypothetical protein ACSQ67_007998 [Phaseolus vulgaris]